MKDDYLRDKDKDYLKIEKIYKENYLIDDYKKNNIEIIKYGNILTDKIRPQANDADIALVYSYFLKLSADDFRTLYREVTKYQNSGYSITRGLLTRIYNSLISTGRIKEIDLTTKPKDFIPITNQNKVGILETTQNEENEKQRLERERLEKERIERERQERERLERERVVNAAIQKFLDDIQNKSASSNFRGWVLPNGILLSQYTDKEKRQDHSSLVKIFMAGVEEYDTDLYNRLKDIYQQYLAMYGMKSGDLDESFAVEALGWMQVSVFGRRNILYRGERWQDRILTPFFVEHNFSYELSNRGRCYTVEFETLYDNIDEIMKLGLKKKYVNTKKI